MYDNGVTGKYMVVLLATSAQYHIQRIIIGSYIIFGNQPHNNNVRDMLMWHDIN